MGELTETSKNSVNMIEGRIEESYLPCLKYASVQSTSIIPKGILNGKSNGSCLSFYITSQKAYDKGQLPVERVRAFPHICEVIRSE